MLYDLKWHNEDDELDEICPKHDLPDLDCNRTLRVNFLEIVMHRYFPDTFFRKSTVGPVGLVT